MELHELHVDQFRAGLVGKGETVTGRFPTVARDLVGAAKPAGSQHDRFGAKDLEPSAFAFVAKRADDALALFQQREDRVLRVNFDPLMNSMILQRPDHLETGAIAHVREARVSVAAKISL